LFLNKIDLLEKKLKIRPIQDFPEKFPDFGDFYEENKDELSESDIAIKYFTYKFQNSYKGEDNMYHFPTCAIDTEQVSNVFKSVKDSILDTTMKDVGVV